MSELVISNVQGWVPTTRLYRGVIEDDDYWLISAITVSGVRNATVDVVAAANDIDSHSDTAPPGVGHVEIYRATVTETPVCDWVQTAGPPAPEADDYELTYTDDTHLIATRDGIEYRAELQQVRIGYAITAIDADGDPLNGLTPQWVLPHGTTFDEALTHIQQHQEA